MKGYDKVLSYKKSIYPLDTLFGALYKLIDFGYFFVDEDEDSWLVYIKTQESDSDSLVDRLNREILFQRLRGLIAEKNAKIREYIIGRALYALEEEDSFAKILDEIGESEEDLDSIMMPWEERFKDKKE